MEYGSKEHCVELAKLPDTSDNPEWLRSKLFEYMNKVELQEVRIAKLEADLTYWENESASYDGVER